jgi:hypothetical protein
VVKLTGASGRTLIFDDGTTLLLPPCFRVESRGAVFLIAATRGPLTQVAIAPAGSARADVEGHVWQTLDGLNRRGWWHQG